MSKFFEDLFGALASYFRAFLSNDFQGWWLPFFAVLLVLFFTPILLWRFKPRLPRSREFQALRMLNISICTVMGATIGAFCYLWADTDYYLKNEVQFIHWLTLLLLTSWLVANCIRLASMYDRYKLKGLNRPAYSLGENARFLNAAKSLFQKSKLWLVLPVTGFLLLLLVLNKPNYLVAVLLDNSSSMDVNIETGKAAISETFSGLDDHTDLILSWFTEKSPKDKLNEVRSTQRWDRLEGNHAYFQDKNQALQHLNTIDLTGGTPLYETIYSLYLYTQDQTANSNYEKKVLILVTDGGEGYLNNDPGALSEMLCRDLDFDQFWDEVGVMNLGGNLTEPFYDLAMNECQYFVEEDATSLTSYQSGLEEMVESFKHDWFYPIWLAIASGLGLLACMLIPPKNY